MRGKLNRIAEGQPRRVMRLNPKGTSMARYPETMMIDEVPKYIKWEYSQVRKDVRLVTPCVLKDRVFPFMCETLGRVKIRADGRWNWWAKPTSLKRNDWVCDKHEQGVAPTIEDAMSQVEQFYRPAN